MPACPGLPQSMGKTKGIGPLDAEHPLRGFLKLQMPEPNLQRSPVLWFGDGREQTYYSKKEKRRGRDPPRISPAQEIPTQSGVLVDERQGDS